VICCDAISGLIIRSDKHRRLESLGHAVHVMHGKSAAKVYYHAMPVNIEASFAYLLGVKAQVNNNFGWMISTLCHLFPQSMVPFLTLPGGLLMTILIFTLMFSIQRGHFSIEAHLTSLKSLVYLFNLLSQLDCG
jgi:hypothetical protein